MPVSEQTYRAVVLEDSDAQWELYDGRLREKPPMSAEHNDVIARLALVLGNQLDWRQYRVRINSAHVRRSERSYFVPDLFVVPTERFHEQIGQPGHLEVYEAPLPLVIEVWSPTTGSYDVDAKIPEYQARGDREIWRLQPYERTLTAWRRQPEEAYTVEIYRGGTVRSAALPQVTVDLDTLCDFS
jgi:Uma2 family endonuclease